MLLQALSLGGEVDVWKPQSGMVHSAFDHAINLLVDGELWTVLGAGRQDVPFGIRLAAGGGRGGFNVQTNDRVHVRAGYLGAGDLILDCRTASRWTPTHWARPTDCLDARLSAVERIAGPRAWAESAAMANDVTRALRRSGSGADADLASTIRRTVGRGPGLTPAGDDVLVGILAVLSSAASGSLGTRAKSQLERALMPVLHSTTDVSRHLLDQAARGLRGRALHNLGKAVVEGMGDDILADTLDLVLDNGATSGADACMGFAAACRFSFLDTERAAA